MADSKKYVVLHGNAGPHAQGALITKEQAGDSHQFWLDAGAIREATEEEAKQGDPGEVSSGARSVEETTGDMKLHESEFVEAQGGNATSGPTKEVEAEAAKDAAKK